MRVLHIGKYYPPFPGGMETYLGDLVTTHRADGLKVACLVHRHSRQEEPAIDVDRVPSYGQIIYAPLSPAFPLWLARSIRKYRPDLLHLHLPNTSAFWALTSKSARSIPWVLQWHADVGPGHGPLMSFAYRTYARLEQRLLSRSVRIIVSSPNYLQSSPMLARWRQKARVIPLGRNPDALQPPTREDLIFAEKLWGRGSKRVLAIGRMTYYKGYEYLVRAMPHSVDTKLIIVGQGTRKQLKPLLRDGELSEKVILADYQPPSKLVALLSTCHCICLPSIDRAEAFGIVLLEAMHFAKPVIASNVLGSGIGWIVDDGRTGRLVPPRDVEALRQSICDLFTYPQIWKEMGFAARHKFDRCFHIRHSADRTLDLYREILGDRI